MGIGSSEAEGRNVGFPPSTHGKIWRGHKNCYIRGGRSYWGDDNLAVIILGSLHHSLDVKQAEYLSVFPLAKKFRYNGIMPELEEKLDIMFGRGVATGADIYVPNSGVLPPKLRDVEELASSEEEHEDDKANTLHTDSLDGPIIGDSQRSNNTRPITHKRKKIRRTKPGGRQMFIEHIEELGRHIHLQKGKPPVHAASPPMGYPVNNSVNYSQQVPVKTRKRGDGFWKGCCAALYYHCLVDMCI
ncbi:hypothetical protein IEQ34_012559 [Dendrobium chrysotoxum]|uniref:Cysteine-rich transmembrane domain-containing protein n=1 Tax=Dendrobium chrysotoxum TaxID=161865 RepID=A0AAV7GUK2_DENCH|nr:hypothetical protein IEQ34_012559 [Dendrobium chrysotoxum]